MRQTRLSIGCQDWQEIVAKIGPAATGVLLYLRLAMRNMQASEITISNAELAAAMMLDTETVCNLICAILDAELLDAVPGPDGLTTYQSKEEAAALADRFRKQVSSSRRKLAAMPANLIPCLSGNSSQKIPAKIPENICKAYETEVFMEYHAPSGNSEEKEKKPHTPQKEESLTEIQTHTRSRKTCDTSLPVDQLEADYIDVCGAWPDSLRGAVRSEAEDVREAFYLCIRTRQGDEGHAWTADRVRMALLAARRIPQERRADSILAWGMGGWKTIRDAGSGCYFEKDTGRVVSLVRGPVETRRKTAAEQLNEELAARFARNMRRE